MINGMFLPGLSTSINQDFVQKGIPICYRCTIFETIMVSMVHGKLSSNGYMERAFLPYLKIVLLNLNEL